MKRASLHDRDFVEWTSRNAALLRAGRFADADIAQIADEIEDMGGGERKALDSHTTRLLMHLLKWQVQARRRNRSWRLTILNQRVELAKGFRRAPSLRRHFEEALQENYADARKLASEETGIARERFPAECPYRIEQILDEEYLPE